MRVALSNTHDRFPPEEKKKEPTEFKIVTILPDEKIVGLHILGKGCDEMMQGFGSVHPTALEMR